MRIPLRKPPSTGCRDCMHGGFAETSASGSTHGQRRLRILGRATGSGLPIPSESVPGAARWRHQPQTNATSLRHAADQHPSQLARGPRTRRVTISFAVTRSSRQMSCRSRSMASVPPVRTWPIPADFKGPRCHLLGQGNALPICSQHAGRARPRHAHASGNSSADGPNPDRALLAVAAPVRMHPRVSKHSWDNGKAICDAANSSACILGSRSILGPHSGFPTRSLSSRVTTALGVTFSGMLPYE